MEPFAPPRHRLCHPGGRLFPHFTGCGERRPRSHLENWDASHGAASEMFISSALICATLRIASPRTFGGQRQRGSHAPSPLISDTTMDEPFGALDPYRATSARIRPRPRLDKPSYSSHDLREASCSPRASSCSRPVALSPAPAAGISSPRPRRSSRLHFIPFRVSGAL